MQKLLGIKWCHHVQHDEVRRTTGQPSLLAVLAIGRARHFSLFGYIARMPDETDAKILTGSQWRTGGDHQVSYYVDKDYLAGPEIQ